MAKTKEAKTASDREIVQSRLIDAPRERVWAALTNPAQLDSWWGPDGFRNATQEFSMRTGGVWRHVMIGPDGAEYPNLARFEEVVAPERVVFVNTGGRKGGPGARMRQTWTLKAVGRKTEVTIHLVFATPQECRFVAKEFGAVEGGRQTLGRMAAHAEKNPAFELMMERVIDAPRERVWAAWAEPEQIKRWFAPKPYVLSVKSMDLRPGGSFKMAMHGPGGVSHDFGGVYREVAPPARLVWTGELMDGPPEQIRTEVTFTEEGKKTKVWVRQTFSALTPMTRPATQGARQGWTMTLDQLAEHVEKA